MATVAEPILDRTRSALAVLPDDWSDLFMVELVGLQRELTTTIATCHPCRHRDDLIEAQRQLAEMMPRVHRCLTGPPEESVA